MGVPVALDLELHHVIRVPLRGTTRLCESRIKAKDAQGLRMRMLLLNPYAFLLVLGLPKTEHVR